MEYKTKKKLQIALRRYYLGHSNNYITDYVGADMYTFVEHISKYMLSGMTSENFGKVWGLDHIVPVDLFDSEKIEELKLCYNYNNIMPMFNRDNRLKGASVHFSLAKLRSMYTNVVIDQLKEKCINEISNTYEKYLV